MSITKNRSAIREQQTANESSSVIFHTSVGTAEHLPSKLNLKCADSPHPYSSSSDEGELFSSMSGDDSDSPDLEKRPSPSPKVRRSSQSGPAPMLAETVPTRPPSTSSWTDLDLSVVVALVAPVGNWLTGNDHLKNLFLILLLIVYLHQVIQVPWELYHSARARRPHPSISPYSPQSSMEDLARLASSELRKHELTYLLLSIVAPFLGAHLLRYVLSTLSGTDAISWFSTTLFVLATGIRPWSHLIARLRDRTGALHDTIHYPSPDAQLIADSGMAARVRVEEAYEELSAALEDVEHAVKKRERKAESTRTAYEARLVALEKAMKTAGDKRTDTTHLRLVLLGHTPPSLSHGHPPSYLSSVLIQWIYVLWSVLTLNYAYDSVSPSTRTRHL
ncbi:hypothetical protein HETIRDRAFT_459684, partial [Heterobasidion irregulare TC 32-1]